MEGKMKFFCAVVFALFVVVLASVSFGIGPVKNKQLEDKQLEDDLLSSIVGSYDIIGCLPESTQTFFGEVTFRKQGRQLIFERIIDGRKVIGEAVIMTATADDVPVLQASFTENEIAYAATYLLHSDLDNYRRMSGYVYHTGKEIKRPGLEAFFIRHDGK